MSGSLVLSFLRTAVPMWVGTIFVAAGTIGAVATFGEWRAQQHFQRNAVPVEGRIVALPIAEANRDDNTRSRYLATYRFTGHDGAPVERTEEISVEEWEALAQDSPVTLRWLPGDAASARIRADGPPWVQPLMVGALALFALVGIAIARPYWRRAWVLARLQRTGISSLATVVEVAPSGTTINRVPQWHVAYEYSDERGAAQRGKSDLLTPAEAAEWRVGDRGAIRFDRNRPSDSVWIGRR